MSLNHVCMWQDKGWKRVKIEEVSKKAKAGISAKSGIFMCELCGQHVTYAKGDKNTPYFRHASGEESSLCPEKSTNNGYYHSTNNLNLETRGLPIKINIIKNSSFKFVIGLPKISDDIFYSLQDKQILIRDSNNKTHRYLGERLEKNEVTYLGIGEIPALEYGISTDVYAKEIQQFWPRKVKGISDKAIFSAMTGTLLPNDSDVLVDKGYYVLTTGRLNSCKYVQCKKLFTYKCRTLYKVKAVEYGEESAKFFLDLHCRLTESPIRMIPIWPVTIHSPYLYYHKENYLFTLIKGNAVFSTFPQSSFSQSDVMESNLIRLNCNGRQQLLSIGRTSKILNYTYLWKDDFNFKNNDEITIQVFDDKNNPINTLNGCNIKWISFTPKYDGKFVVMKDEFRMEEYNLSANEMFTYNNIINNRTYKILQSNDCIWESNSSIKTNEESIKSKEESIKFDDGYLLSILKRSKGNKITIAHSYGQIARNMKGYPLSKIWLRKK